MKPHLLFLIGLVVSSLSWATETINDVTNINPVQVQAVLRPETNTDISKAVKTHTGAVSIGGARYSQGGQIASENSLHLDMRGFNQILALDKNKKQVRVQSGVTWRQLQELIDRENLSVRIMQSFANFSVGGSVSVNAHGRYVGEGPIIRSLESIKLILANGEEVEASPTKNSDLFFAAVGGYGGVGIITEVVLNLTENTKIEKTRTDMPIGDYAKYFQTKIHNNPKAVLHNANIYPPEYNHVSSEDWVHTDKDLSVKDRLTPKDKYYWLEPNLISVLSNMPFGQEIRQHWIEPLRRPKETVVWRNYEASLDVGLLEPKTPRLLWTYVLQEYFIPVENFDQFVPKMREIFKKHNVNVINVSIRHAEPDTGSNLAWAPKESYSFVVYYKQLTTEAAKAAVGVWTREMIDAALSENGRYYLPYQLHATPEQFKAAYPGFQKFSEVKQKYDPTNKFRNKLWDKYYESDSCESDLKL